MVKDYHIHPQIIQNPNNFDSFVKTALKNGVQEICITDHMPLLGSSAGDRIPHGAVREYCEKAEDALDLVTPTVNYHPLLPLKAVEVTYGRCIAEIHSSGVYDAFAKKIGGVDKVLETLYETEVNAIINSPYPSILGHFFAAHSYAVGEYNWFGASSKHLRIMDAGADKIIDACVKTGTMIDLTGIHCGSSGYDKKQNDDGFFYDYQKRFIQKCINNNVLIFPGSDAHGLIAVGDIGYYRQKLYWGN